MTDETRMPKRRELPSMPAGNESIVRDPGSGQVHFLNATAAIVWECCDGRTTTGECAARIRGAFDVPADADLAADIGATLDGFAGKGMLETFGGSR